MINLLDKAYLIRVYIQGFPNSGLDNEQLRAFDRLQNFHLVRVNAVSKDFEVTERGKVLCEALRSMPMPEQQWVMPDPPQI